MFWACGIIPAMRGSNRAPASNDASPLVRANVLKGFRETVEKLGGTPEELLGPTALPDVTQKDATMPYRSLVNLLERSSERLNCADFGLRLAGVQEASALLGPLGIAMRSSRTLGDALRYNSSHISGYFCSATRNPVENQPGGRRVRLGFEILLSGLPHQRQAVEHALLLGHTNVINIGGGQVRAREVWFTHDAISSPLPYRAFGSAKIRFGQEVNALIFERGDLERPLPGYDELLYELATSFIETRFPALCEGIAQRVRETTMRLLRERIFSHGAVADALGMKLRSLQRRLQVEGTTLEEIKDQVRRDLALHYLGETTLPMAQIAERLGYAEHSVLSRSCNRWFAMSPQRLRREGIHRD
jgi:AraC-like DNA-binding protein